MNSDAVPGRVEQTPFAIALCIAVGLLFWLCLRVAQVEWFSSDDFSSLAEVRREPFGWLETFLPAERRRWFYRPLGVDAFFHANYRLFGLHAPSYFAQSLLLHFATGLLFVRLARQLGFALPIAWTGAVLAVTRFPSMDRIYYGALFSYVAAVFASTASLSLLVDAARGRGRGFMAAACAAHFAALLCHEYAVVFVAIQPFVVLCALERPIRPREIPAALRRCVPLYVVTAGYLVLRFGLIGPAVVESPYFHLFCTNLVTNYLAYAWIVAGGWPGLLVAMFVFVAAAASLPREDTERDALGRWLERVLALAFVWASASVVLFLTQPIPNTRYGILIEVPACLAFAAALEVLWRRHAATHGRALLAGLLVLTIAAMPWFDVTARVAAPQNPSPRELIRLIQRTYPGLGDRSRVVILYGGDGMANVAQGTDFEKRLFGRTAMLRALFPERKLDLVVHDLAVPPSNREICRNCVYFVLQPDLGFHQASADDLRALFSRGTRSTDEAVARMARQAIAALDDKLERRTRRSN